MDSEIVTESLEESYFAPVESSSTTESAAVDIDWNGLRQLSLRPGGFGEERVKLWPKLLKVDPLQEPITTPLESHAKPYDDATTTSSHPDERTIQMDSNRSFVMYPVDVVDDARDTLKDGLHKLLVSIFRRRPKLSYFQGYHDITSVIYLTLPPEVHLPCMEKLSLYRVRDCMVSTLDPVVGLLRVTSNLLRLADVEYANVLQENSSLPFYALANLMTLFSHDMPSLTLIQHVFDYLLCRPPTAVVYLTVAILLSRKTEVLRLQGEGDEGMIHSLLNALPDIVDETPSADQLQPIKAMVPLTIPEVPTPIAEEHKEVQELSGFNSFQPSPNETTHSANFEDAIAPSRPPSDVDASSSLETREIIPLARKGSREARRLSNLSSRSASRSMSPSHPSASGRSRSSTLSSSRHGSQSCLPHLAGHPLLDDEEVSRAASTVKRTREMDGRSSGSRPRVTLSELLQQADELYLKFPPDSPDLKLSAIMGPQSVMFTWKEQDVETEEGEDRDAEAEAMVLCPELIVYPYIPEQDVDGGKEVKEVAVDETGKRRRRKLYKARRFDRRTKSVFAGAVIVLGVAMAVYGIRAQRGGGSGSSPHVQKRWSQGRQWFGSALAGITVKWAQELGLGGDAQGHGEL